MRVAYADPPYPGQAKRLYGDHPDYAGEVDHRELIERMERDYDAWCLHTSAPALPSVLAHMTFDALGFTNSAIRIFAWVKPFAAFKRNVSPAYAWEPVIVKVARHAEPNQSGIVMRDWYSEPITMQRGLAGAKPERVCFWLFEAMGLEPEDELDDLFPGTGAVTRAWERWCRERPLPLAAQALSEKEGSDGNR